MDFVLTRLKLQIVADPHNVLILNATLDVSEIEKNANADQFSTMRTRIDTMVSVLNAWQTINAWIQQS